VVNPNWPRRIPIIKLVHTPALKDFHRPRRAATRQCASLCTPAYPGRSQRKSPCGGRPARASELQLRHCKMAVAIWTAQRVMLN
jgi:hypothetical protein